MGAFVAIQTALGAADVLISAPNHMSFLHAGDI